MRSFLLILMMLAGISVAAAKEDSYTQSWLNDGEIKYVTLDNSIKMRYLEVGQGPPLLLIHTIRTQLDYFQKLIPRLSPHYRVYAIDLPGHGYSDISSVAYTETFYRESVVNFVKKLNLTDLTVVGESIGGVLALTVSEQLQERVTQIFSLNPYDYGEKYGGGIRRSSLIGNVIIGSFGVPVLGVISSHMENRLLLRKILHGGFYENKNLPDDLLMEFNSVGFRKGYRMVERSVFSNWKSWKDARDRYKEVLVPVTFIYGDHDWSRAEERELNQRAVPRSRLHTLKDTSHFSSLEKAEEIAGIILREKN